MKPATSLWRSRTSTLIRPRDQSARNLWLVLAGWWLALGHLITAVMLAVTIVGIPFAWAHVKLAGLALWPIGKMIVPA
jgi:uncharacterized membrane protein YccF (DUF307 family)